MAHAMIKPEIWGTQYSMLPVSMDLFLCLSGIYQGATREIIPEFPSYLGEMVQTDS